MTNKELTELCAQTIVNILSSKKDTTFTAKSNIIQALQGGKISFTDEELKNVKVLPDEEDQPTQEQTPDADYEESNVVPLVSTTILDPTLEEKIKDAL